MAEIAIIAGVSITVPAILQGAWKILKGAYDLYGQVDNRKEEVKALLDRCSELIKRIAEELHLHPGASLNINNAMQNLEGTCASVQSLVQTLAQKGFLWILIHADKIDRQIQSAETSITDAFTFFNSVVQLDGARFLADIEKARRHDQETLSTRLKDIASNDANIIRAIRDVNGVNRRMEEVLVAIYKCVETLPGTAKETTPEGAFIKSAAGALMRVSGQRVDDKLAPWVVSSVDVEFDQDDLIGQGSFGRIFKGEWNGVIVAIKQMFREDAIALSDNDRKLMRNEVLVWSQLSHPNVLSLFGACPEATYPFLLMRFCQLGNILQYLKSHPDANRASLSYDIAAGLSFLHSQHIIHADLKGANVLVGDDHHALLTDFGLSLIIDDVRSRSTMRHTGETRGTLRWMAPECLDGSRVNEASDTYSLGITIWEVYSEEVPFTKFNNSIVFFQIQKGVRPERPQRLAQDPIWDLVQWCWKSNAIERPRVDEVRQSLKPYTSYARPDDFAPLPLSPKTSTWSSSRTHLGAEVVKAVKPGSGDDQNSQSEPLDYLTASLGRSTINTSSLRVSAQPWSQTEWADALRFNPPRWQRGNPHNYLDSVIFPMLPAGRTYSFRIIKGTSDLGVRPTYPRNGDGSQTVNLLEYNQGYGISDTTPIRVVAIDPEGHEVLVATAEWSSYLRSSPPEWTRRSLDNLVDGVAFSRIPSKKPYTFRVFKGTEDLGVELASQRPDGSMHIRFADYNHGGRISDIAPIYVYAVDPEGHEEMVAVLDAGKLVLKTPSLQQSPSHASSRLSLVSAPLQVSEDGIQQVHHPPKAAPSRFSKFKRWFVPG